MKHPLLISLLAASLSLVSGLSARAHDLGSALPHPHPHPAPGGSPEAVFTLVLVTTLIGLAGLAYARLRESRDHRSELRRVPFRSSR